MQAAAVSPPKTILDQVVESGQLRVATSLSPTSYYLNRGEPSGFEYELASRFADWLGVELVIETPDDVATVLGGVTGGGVQIGADGLTRTKERIDKLDFGPAYRTVTPQLVYRRGTPAPTRLGDIEPGELVVMANSSHAELLQYHARLNPNLRWEERVVTSQQELIEAVNQGSIKYTVANSTSLALLTHQYPEIAVALDLGPEEPVAWVLPKTRDRSLHQAVENFFIELSQSGELRMIEDQFLRPKSRLDHDELRDFHQLLSRRLADLLPDLRTVGDRMGVDWLLLAAISYQESRWIPSAISASGRAKGLMMLSGPAAHEVAVRDRLDTVASIEGGARYLLSLKQRLRSAVAEPDLTWLALAAYNTGLGHLSDARLIARRNGDDPDSWHGVRKTLPLLQQSKWHRNTRHGFARGNLTVAYVDTVRTYYDLLIDMENSGALERLKPSG